VDLCTVGILVCVWGQQTASEKLQLYALGECKQRGAQLHPWETENSNWSVNLLYDV
jgi:hypothetical protein